MVHYFASVLVVALFLVSTCVSGKEQEEPPKVRVTSAATAVPSKMTKVPVTVPWGMTPEEEEKKMREMAEEDKIMRQQLLEESNATEAALKKAEADLNAAKAKLEAAKEKLKKVAPPCALDATKDVSTNTFLAKMSAAADAPCEEAKAEVEAAEKAVREAERLRNYAQDLDTVAKEAVSKSKYSVVYTPQGHGHSKLGMCGRDPRSAPNDGALCMTVVMNAVFLLFVTYALVN